MAPGTQIVVNATMAWLQSSWHIHVPFAWLETCVEWVQEEGGGGRLTQRQINQQVLDQWLLADLRDLSYPVLPDGLSQAQKIELSGTFCVQVDSLLDISQPAYGQLQKFRGKDHTNEDVTAVTQATQRPWEAKPTRMLLLQVTDGVQNLEAMEYQPIPALNTSLRPGVKLQLVGPIVCRLGVLLLGPHHIKVLGGEVEDLVDRNNQGRMLCRALGLPEEEQQTGETDQENPPAQQQANHERENLDLDDQELLANLEAQEELERSQGRPPLESGYGTASEASSTAYRSLSAGSHASTPLSRSKSTTLSHGGSSVQASRNSLVHPWPSFQGDPLPSDPPSSTRLSQYEVTDHNFAEDNFPDEDFDDLPLDELDSVIFQESTNETLRSGTRHRDSPQTNNEASERSHEDASNLPDDRDFMDMDMDYCFPKETGTLQSSGSGARCGRPLQHKEDPTFGVVHGGPVSLAETRGGAAGVSARTQASDLTNGLAGHSLTRAIDTPVSNSTSQGMSHKSRAAESDVSSPFEAENIDATPALTSPPFTYLCVLQGKAPRHRQPRPTGFRIKAFIVTLLGKLTSSDGMWGVRATISDGTGYLDVELSDRVLMGLLGFSVAQKGAMKREPGRRAELDAGMQRCREELVDMCCVMTVSLEEPHRNAVVTRADPVTEEDLLALEQRLGGGG